MAKAKTRAFDDAEVDALLGSGLFDAAWFADASKLTFPDERAAAAHYLSIEPSMLRSAKPMANPLFDEGFYLRTHADVRRAGVHPLLHYAGSGRREGRAPGPLFDTAWYESEYVVPPEYVHDSLAYHLDAGRAAGNDPNSMFDGAWYLDRYPDVAASNTDPLQHYLAQGANERRDPGPHFSTGWFLARHPTLIRLGENPLAYYLSNHRGERTSYVASDFGHGTGAARPGWEHLARHGVIMPRVGQGGLPDPDKPTILFVTHEMSRTGAPLIILALVKHFAQLAGCELITFTDRAGDLLSEFRRYSHVVDMSRHRIDDERLNLADLVTELSPQRPILALCNTANTNQYSGPFAGLGIPVINLVHEMLYVYPTTYVEELYAYASRVIFPSRFVRDVADTRVPLLEGRSLVLPQGLLDAEFGRDVEHATIDAVRQKLGIPSETPIILGCGTVNIRKGVDLFVGMAQRIFAKHGDQVHFVWLGADRYDPDYSYWVKKDVDAVGLSEVFHFTGQQDDTAPYYLAAQAFAMTSREDPFPCVIHEAMVCGLPIVAFEGAGGAPEAIAEGSGLTVPYRDIEAMADAVMGLLADPARHAGIAARAKARVDAEYTFGGYFEKIVALARHELGVALPDYLPTRDPSVPKVIFLARDWWISGVNSFSETLVGYLLDHGVDAEIAFPSFNEHNRDFLPDLPVRLLEMAGPIAEQWQQLIQFVESNAPCIIVPNYDYISSAVTPALSSKVGAIGIVHSDDVEHYDHVDRMGRYWNAIVCSNAHLRDKVLAINPLFGDKTSVIPYGVTVPQYERAPRAADAPLRIVYCGRLVQHQKRVRDLVGLTRRLDRDGVPFHLTVVGEGDETQWLKDQWLPLTRRGAVELVGRVSREEMYDIFHDHDVFTLVSDFEGMPISLIEAMGCGCVPVVSDIPSGIPDLIRDGTGYRFPIGDMAAAAAAMRRLQASPGLVTSLSDGARHHIATHGFRTEDMGRAYLELIRKIWGEISMGTYERAEPLIWQGPVANVQPPSFIFPRN